MFIKIGVSQTVAILVMSIFSFGISLTNPHHTKVGPRQCCKNPDQQYDRQVLLEEFDRILKTSIPAYAQFPRRGFFVYDLNEPTNKYIPTSYVQADLCIRFINNHVYHFAPVEFAFSQSHVAVLDDGEMKIFKSINCKDTQEHVTDVVAYMEKRLKRGPDWEELVTRIRNYRKYGFYINTDSPDVSCNADSSKSHH